VILDRETGFLCNTEDDLVEAVHSLAMIDCDKCRQEADTFFDVKMFAPKVLEILHTLIRMDR
jgi:hypothetical protein